MFPGRFDRFNHLQTLDPQRDHVEIVQQVGMYEAPWITRRALEYALFRTYAVPSMSALLDKSGQFYQHGQKRYDDTALLIAEFVEHGYDSERGRAAIRRMNQMHRRYASITNDEFLYVLSVFIYEPVRWAQRFGWRPPAPTENRANYYFWVEVGRRMGIKEIPPTYEAFEQFNRDYEAANFRYSASNRRVGDATIGVFLSWFPTLLHPLVRRCLYAMMDEPLLAAFGYPRQPRWLTRLLEGGMLLRAALLRHVLPPRRTPYRLTEQSARSYPHGYTLDDLGVKASAQDAAETERP